MNECTTGLARCYYPHSHCFNQAGGYQCICDPGYTSIGRLCMGKPGILMCVLIFILIYSTPDVNECRIGTHSCDENARCINTPGSYQCECNTGFTGDGFTCRAQEQSQEPLECGPGYAPWGLKCMGKRLHYLNLVFMCTGH